MMYSLSRTTDDQNDEREKPNENSSDADTLDEVLCNPRLFSFLNGRRTFVRALLVLPGDARRMTIRLNQEADGVCPAADIHAVLEAVYTPPK